MTPYYSEDGITIYLGDCRDLLPGLLSVHVTVTDPPYNLGIDYGTAVNDQRFDYEEWCAEWFKLLPDGPRAIACGIANVGMWHRILSPTWIIAWHKPATMGRGPLGFNNWEPVLIWGKPQGEALTDVVVAPIIPDPTVEGHPCPKPLKWATGLIERMAGPDDIILDPFMGSGTTLKAAKMLGRRAVGIEVNERYCEIAVKRLAQGVLVFD